MLSSLAKQAGNTGCVIIKTLTEQEKEIMRRKGILNYRRKKKNYSQLNAPKAIEPRSSHSKAQD